jgi:hypothetical protein
MNAMSRPYVVWHRVDGSLGTVAASLHSGVESPCTVACPLHMTNRSTPYYHHPATSMCCTHLILAIRQVWLVLYTFNVLSTLWPGEAMMSLMSGALGTYGHVSEAESHGAHGDARALPHREAGLES